MSIAELRALLAKASAGPWTHSRDTLWASITRYGFEIMTSRMADRDKATADAALVAAALTALPALLDVFEGAGRIVAKLGTRDGLEFMSRDASLEAYWKSLRDMLRDLEAGTDGNTREREGG